MHAVLGRLVIYTRKTDEMVQFYSTFFGYSARWLDDDRIVELVAPDGGINLLLHPAAKSQKMGQALVKLVFDVPDVPAHCQMLAARGLAFGTVHSAQGYQFANSKDPSGNSIQISGRRFMGQRHD